MDRVEEIKARLLGDPETVKALKALRLVRKMLGEAKVRGYIDDFVKARAVTQPEAAMLFGDVIRDLVLGEWPEGV